MGLNGAFLTGDLFNLFVFFEVLLVASYCLLAHGRGAERLRAGFHYVAVNLAASALFLIGVALLYAVTGTLNLADLALRVPRVAPADAPLVRAAALVLLVVFAVKAAVFPLCLWLPAGLRARRPAGRGPVRDHDQGRRLRDRARARARVRPRRGRPRSRPAPGCLAGAVATAGFGALGALAARSLARMTAYLTLASIGTLLIAVGAASTASLGAALYYLVHSTLVTAALFLLADRIAAQRGGDGFEPAPPVAQPAVLGALFVSAPRRSPACRRCPASSASSRSSRAPRGAGDARLWGVLLAAGLLAMIGLARAGSALFWKTTGARRAGGARQSSPRSRRPSRLLACGAALALFAAPVQRFADAAARAARRPAPVRGDGAAERRVRRRPGRLPPGNGPTVKRWLPHPVVSGLVLAVWLALHSSLAPIHLVARAAAGRAGPARCSALARRRGPRAPALGRHPSRARRPVGHRRRQRRGRAAGARADVAPAARLRRGAARPGAPRRRRAAREHHRHHARAPSSRTSTMRARGSWCTCSISRTPRRSSSEIKHRYERPLKEIFGC